MKKITEQQQEILKELYSKIEPYSVEIIIYFSAYI